MSRPSVAIQIVMLASLVISGFAVQAEARGTVFKDQGVAKPGLQIFRDHGYNWIRLRLFNSPDRLPNDLAYTIALAREAREL